MNYIPNKKLLLLKFVYSKPQERRPFKRKKYAICSTNLKNYKKIKTSAYKLRFDAHLMKTYNSFKDKKSMESKEEITKLPRVESCQDCNELIKNDGKKRKIIQSRSLQTFRDLRQSKILLDEAEDIPKSMPTKYSFGRLSSEDGIVFNDSSEKKKKTLKKVKESKHNLQNLLLNCQVPSFEEEDDLSSKSLEKLPTKKKTSEVHEEEKIEKKEDITINFRMKTEEKLKAFSLSRESSEKKEFDDMSNRNTAIHDLKKSQFSQTKTSTIKTIPLKEFNLSDLNEMNEKMKEKNLFLYDFESLSNFAIYFPEGNVKNILMKFSKSKRRQTRNYRNSSNKKAKLENLDASFLNS